MRVLNKMKFRLIIYFTIYVGVVGYTIYTFMNDPSNGGTIKHLPPIEDFTPYIKRIIINYLLIFSGFFFLIEIILKKKSKSKNLRNIGNE